jgi:hypothetical protein
LSLGSDTGILKDRFFFKDSAEEMYVLKNQFRRETWAIDKGSNLIIGWAEHM